MELLATTSVSADNDEHYGVIAEHTLRIPRSDIVATAALGLVLPVITRLEDANTGPDNAFFAFVSGYRRGDTGAYVYLSGMPITEQQQVQLTDVVAVTFALYIIRGMGVAVGTVFGTPRAVYGSPTVTLDAAHTVVDGVSGKVRHTSLVSTVDGAEPGNDDPAEEAMRSARFWLPESEDLQLVRHDSPPSPSTRLRVWPD
jgi:hypothetical protein